MIKRKFTFEMEADDESDVELYGEDMVFTVCHHLATALTETGYKIGKVKYHHGHNSRLIEIRPGRDGEPPTITGFP